MYVCIVKSKLLRVPSDRDVYHRRSRSDELLQKSKQKYDMKASRKRAENDGYMKFIRQESIIGKPKSNKAEQEPAAAATTLGVDKNKKNRLAAACLATAETVICNNKASNIEVVHGKNCVNY